MTSMLKEILEKTMLFQMQLTWDIIPPMINDYEKNDM